MKRIYVISGGPGFGKTALIDILEKKGFYCGKDVAREFIKEQIRKDGKILPWENRLEFSKIILQKRIKQYEDAPKGKIVFFDRGIPDIIGYIIKDKLEVSKKYYIVVEKYKYQKTIFFTPPWKKLFKKDPERKETFDEATTIHNTIKKVYQDLNYKVINIPKTSINKRMNFILSKIEI